MFGAVGRPFPEREGKGGGGRQVCFGDVAGEEQQLRLLLHGHGHTDQGESGRKEGLGTIIIQQTRLPKVRLCFSRRARKITPGRFGPGNKIRLSACRSAAGRPSQSVREAIPKCAIRKGEEREEDDGKKSRIEVSLLMSVRWISRLVSVFASNEPE